MLSVATALYQLPAARALLADEATALRPQLAGLAGGYGLCLAAHDAEALPPTPMLGRWLRLRVQGAHLCGDVGARADEPLPFLDDAFRVVVLSHALELAPHPRELLEEAARVLAPGGLLALSGFHPASLWTPWLHWQCRQVDAPALSWPRRWQLRLLRHGVEAYALRRVGRLLPLRGAQGGAAGGLRGGYVLLARKRRAALTPLPLPAVGVRPAVPAQWAPGAHRECA